MCRFFVLGDERGPGEKRLTYLMETHTPLDGEDPAMDDEVAQIVYTSGPSGHPVGAQLTHNNIHSNIEACREFFQLSADDAVVGAFPFSHPVGHVFVMGAFLQAGARVVLMPGISPESILKVVESRKVTYLVGVPSFYRELINVKESRNLSSLKFCLSTGDAMNPDTMKAFEEKYGIPVLDQLIKRR